MTERDVEEAARIALRWGVRALVVKPCHVPLAARLLADSGVKVVTVIGFPHGGQTTETKVYETRQAVERGAQEVDMVINIGALRQGQMTAVFYEIRAVVEAAAGRPVKVILENTYLTDVQKRLACRLTDHAGAAYVKTSTGFAPHGATATDVALMRRTVRRSVGVKAAGGIRTYTDAIALLQVGADLLGTSATNAILSEAASEAA
jgi:deoxyribose-phosphate aldolase